MPGNTLQRRTARKRLRGRSHLPDSLAALIETERFRPCRWVPHNISPSLRGVVPVDHRGRAAAVTVPVYPAKRPHRMRLVVHDRHLVGIMGNRIAGAGPERV